MPTHTTTMTRAAASRELLAELAALDEGRAVSLPGTTWAGVPALPARPSDEEPDAAPLGLPGVRSPVTGLGPPPATSEALPDIADFTAHASARRWRGRRGGRG